MNTRRVFVTGATGYIGRPLCDSLIVRGHQVVALTRPGSERKLPAGVTPLLGNALDADSYGDRVAGCDTFVHLIGTPHPNPSKVAEFHSVDLVSVQQAVIAARSAQVQHFVYLSVAYPAPIMQPYIDVRIEGEALVRGLGISATLARPFYVLGPGHRWPYLVLPMYALLRLVPATREGAIRLAPVTLRAMIGALVAAIENPPNGVLVLDAPAIHSALAPGAPVRHVTGAGFHREE